MEKIKYLLFILISGVFLLIPLACTDNFSSLNTDPALVSKEIINPDMLFSQSLRHGMFNQIDDGSRLKAYAGMHAEPGLGPVLTQGNHSGAFNYAYRELIMPVAEALRLMGDDPVKVNKIAMARIWRVFLYSQITDYYGDIPYTEAVRDLGDGIVQPVYDTQESIYRDMLKELEESVDQLEALATRESFGSADIIYNGDIDMWKRFGNSLRFRLALRVHFADKALATEHLSDVINLPLIESHNQNASLTTEPANTTQTANRNPLYTRVYEAPLGAAQINCDFAVTDILGSKNDPRLPIYCQPISSDSTVYRGRPNNMGPEQGDGSYGGGNTSTVGHYFSESVYTINAITAAEVAFLKAEAYLYNLVSGDPQSAYAEGINLAMAYYDIPQDEIDTYLAGPEGTLTGGEEESLKMIATQKWISLYQNHTEAWAEIRRTGYPAILFGNFPGVTNGEMPRRLTYGESEYNLNFENVSEAAERYESGDDYMSRIWWDAKPGVLDIEHPFQDEPNEAWPPN